MKYRMVLAVFSLFTVIASSFGDEPILIGHRGLLRHAPENTMPAFVSCVELSFGFELDVYSSRDNQLVIIHKANLDSTTDGPNRSIREFTVAELKRFDAGSWFHPDFKGVTIPTLEEVLAMVGKQKRGQTMLALNVKQITPEGEQQLVALITKYGLLNESFAFDQDDACSKRLKSHNSLFLIGQNVGRQNLGKRLVAGDLDVFLLTFIPTPEEMSQLHQKKKVVIFNFSGSGPNYCNPATWDKVKEVGFDGLMTDFPLECRLHWRKQE
ncbi:MAG: glycerophosphodiester phosphodiesterase family protein [Kiritimatiellae bacterium]|nr:glycerophosphodiester phosphodiesterase family protein [Kiritimatiellia bacterium]MDD5519780.1 glycerophosphodiester phosphodiesterase family protein [Kiritimatiellia bacterium]